MTAMLSRLGPEPATIAARPLRPVVLIVKAKWLNPVPAQPPHRSARLSRLNPPDWTMQGLCATLPYEESDALFFGVEVREAPGALIAAANKARQICVRCPVATTCLTRALTEDERYGVWGGTSGRQREKLRLRLAAGASVDELVRECLPDRAFA